MPIDQGIEPQQGEKNMLRRMGQTGQQGYLQDRAKLAKAMALTGRSMGNTSK